MADISVCSQCASWATSVRSASTSRRSARSEASTAAAPRARTMRRSSTQSASCWSLVCSAASACSRCQAMIPSSACECRLETTSMWAARALWLSHSLRHSASASRKPLATCASVASAIRFERMASATFRWSCQLRSSFCAIWCTKRSAQRESTFSLACSSSPEARFSCALSRSTLYFCSCTACCRAASPARSFSLRTWTSCLSSVVWRRSRAQASLSASKACSSASRLLEFSNSVVRILCVEAASSACSFWQVASSCANLRLFSARAFWPFSYCWRTLVRRAGAPLPEAGDRTLMSDPASHSSCSTSSTI
mmetsp:Transcript_51920/g.153057  ORF Transcript_51920/g.153057 Transcript_51920/m.153057 type:complete len:310 (-) Transcript_51920:379-1308(-)